MNSHFAKILPGPGQIRSNATKGVFPISSRAEALISVVPLILVNFKTCSVPINQQAKNEEKIFTKQQSLNMLTILDSSNGFSRLRDKSNFACKWKLILLKSLYLHGLKTPTHQFVCAFMLA